MSLPPPSSLPECWGAYIAGHPSNTQTSLYDFTGKGRNATISGTPITTGSSLGNGAAVRIPYINGEKTTTVQWPIGSIPTNFTICSVTRLTADVLVDSGRLISGGGGVNFIHGHYEGFYTRVVTGIAYYGNNYKTSTVSQGQVISSLNPFRTVFIFLYV